MLFYHIFPYPHESPLHFLKPKGIILFDKKDVRFNKKVYKTIILT